MSPQRRYQRPAALAALLCAALLCAALLSACGGAPSPQAAADAYLAAWARQDWAAMQKLTSGPPASFTAVNEAAFRDLSVRQASFTAGPMHAAQEAANEPVIERLTLAGLGTITIRSALHLVLSHGTWLVKWSPATIAPPLQPGDQLSLQTTWPARAAAASRTSA
jgi:NTF2-like N-terminal transpeptidase domain